MSAFQIKCYLFPTNVKISASNIAQANEIRRFALISNSSGIYSDLVDKIQNAYGDLLSNRNEIKTYWQDDENELVGFSSDAEIKYAIDLLTTLRVSKPYESTSINGTLFKVYVAKKRKSR